MILSMQLSFILSLVLFCVVVQGFDQIEKKSGARQKKLKCNAKKDIKIIPLPSPVSADVAIKHITMVCQDFDQECMLNFLRSS